ncbi:hypothetical protein N7499_007957 [Penicillium canescens]|uniref:MARVEL domain-containing protein n=1 Tax=Penicillium canescens TaxID=5083 RepID=A0AAD6N1S7_PENCN|nr:uncharacterized protein N7446_012994 [Penicillium canescens]KAJ5985751.1 hypothetical protein N7522_012947 [Penicillium canescens]KAJ6022643.1 hypothetical protein N7460_013038 [Penicillium canescens]KAJ6026095.1 hypothetical protein N7444_013774 [Penicillium canescens]KAJ6041928.1 hypothetical protein N7446_012994 [Penicillium canescens]KAJ6075976.1 hypothetical protein N7499_007957 [Penicillium canescens]
MRLVTSVCRFFQLIFTIVVLGLSITLAKGQQLGSVPSETSYGAFSGGIGVLAALIGTVAIFIDSLDGVVTWVLDGVSALALLAAGIIFAVRLHGTSCSDPDTLFGNVLLSGGCITTNDGIYTGCYWDEKHLKSRCTSATADTAFMFLGFIMCIGVLIASFIFRNRR